MRLRILPILIVTSVSMLGLRLGEIWHGFGGIAEAQSEAETDFVEDPFREVQLAQAEAEPAASTEGEGEASGDEAARGDGDEGTEIAATAEGGRGFEDPLDMSDAEIEILQQLSERRKKLDQREQALDRRESLLKAAEKRLKQDVARLQKLKAEIETLLVDYDKQQDRQLTRLVNIYEKMKPDDAARIFENLDMEVLLKVIDRMNERKTAPILAEMQAKRAQTLTLELAKRKDLPVPDAQ